MDFDLNNNVSLGFCYDGLEWGRDSDSIPSERGDFSDCGSDAEELAKDDTQRILSPFSGATLSTFLPTKSRY